MTPPHALPWSCRRVLLACVVALALCFAASGAAMQLDVATVREQAKQRFGPAGLRAVERWLTMLDAYRDISERNRLEVVNGFWNSEIREQYDQQVWGQEDYWATPLESLGEGRGDCEDFVIGKYFSLISLGVEPDKLRFIYVRARTMEGSVAHMVLGYYEHPDAEPLVLDSLTPRIVPARQRRDLTPVFSFNVKGIYAQGAEAASVTRIGRWRDLLQRMRAEGFSP